MSKLKISYQERVCIMESPRMQAEYFKIYQYPCAEGCIDFINRFCYTYDPRKRKDKVLPFELFPRQEEYICWLFNQYTNREDGVVDKCRDVGATWLNAAFMVWLFIFHKDQSCGVYTYKAEECDKLGDISTILPKVRFMISRLPASWTDQVTDKQMYLRNGKTNSDIAGASGDNPGRGGRRTFFFADECAFYPQAEKIEASLSETSDCKIWVSTHQGTNTLFYRKCVSGMPAFTFDWWQIPGHTQEWYDKKKAKAELSGTMHIFSREIDRDPGASVDQVVCPSKWVKSTLRHDYKNEGRIVAGLDVADEGGDTNALVIMDGNTMIHMEEWAEGDTVKTAQRAFWTAVDFGVQDFRYDCIGVGAGVKGGINQILEELDPEDDSKRSEIARNMEIHAWSAAGAVMRPKEDDYDETPNERLFANAKAQAWWKVRNEFLHTYRFIEGEKCDKDKVISFPDRSHTAAKLMNELAQPTWANNSAGKIVIDKKPKGSKSPNVAEAYIIARAEVEAEWIPWSSV